MLAWWSRHSVFAAQRHRKNDEQSLLPTSSFSTEMSRRPVCSSAVSIAESWPFGTVPVELDLCLNSGTVDLLDSDCDSCREGSSLSSAVGFSLSVLSRSSILTLC